MTLLDCAPLFLRVINCARFSLLSSAMADPQLAALMAANLRSRQEAGKEEHVVEASGAGNSKPKPRKPPPGAQQIGMHAMLLQEATKNKVTLKPTPKQWGVQQPDLKDLTGKK